MGKHASAAANKVSYQAGRRSGALWCAWTMAAVLVHGSQNNGAPRATIDPPPSITEMVRTVRIVPELTFAERWQAPAPAMQQAPTPTPKQCQINPRASKSDQASKKAMPIRYAATGDAAISTSGGGFHGDAGDERDSTAR
jgi:hypothetical protein